MDLFDQFEKFKTNLKSQIEHRPHSQQRNTILKTTFIQQSLHTQHQQIQEIQRKKTLQHHRSSTLFSAHKENHDQQKQQPVRFSMIHKQLPEVLPMQQIQQISDILIDCSESQINSLSNQYVEELVKLSGLIMYKVKNSKFYS